MTERRVSECRSCKAEIVWVKTAKGKKMPVDAEPDRTGQFVINGEEDDGTPTVAWMKPGEAERYQGDLYQSHFKTCPQADQHRRPR